MYKDSKDSKCLKKIATGGRKGIFFSAKFLQKNFCNPNKKILAQPKQKKEQKNFLLSDL